MNREAIWLFDSVCLLCSGAVRYTLLALVQHLNGPARLATIGRVVPRIVRDWLYDRIAGNRYRLFGRSETCLRPDAATRGRFVLPEELA